LVDICLNYRNNKTGLVLRREILETVMTKSVWAAATEWWW